MIFVVAFLTALGAGLVLEQIALRIGWVDQRAGLEARKPRTAPVSLVGGTAVLIGVLVAAYASTGQLPTGMPWPALITAYLLGFVDDVAPGGLGVRTKLIGQCLIAGLFALQPGDAFGQPDLVDSLGLALLALVALNAMNLFDHADGLVGGVCAVALAPVAPLWAGAFAGYLPLNTILRRSAAPRAPGDADMGESVAGGPAGLGRERSVPRAMLGDSGSHLAAIAIIQTPASAWLILIPVLDMLRVAWSRARREQPIWRGDRTHLGHRLAALGFSSVGAFALAMLCVLPAVVAYVLSDDWIARAWGHFIGALIYLAFLAITDGEVAVEVEREVLEGELHDFQDQPGLLGGLMNWRQGLGSSLQWGRRNGKLPREEREESLGRIRPDSPSESTGGPFAAP